MALDVAAWDEGRHPLSFAWSARCSELGEGTFSSQRLPRTSWTAPPGLASDACALSVRITSVGVEADPPAEGALAIAVEGAPALVLPPTLDVLPGRELSLYFENVTADPSAAASAWEVAGVDGGTQRADAWAFDAPGPLTGTLRLAQREPAGAEVAAGTVALRAVAPDAGAGESRVTVVGDSLTNAGVITAHLLALSEADPLRLVLQGTRGTGTNRHEGRGGWRVHDYASAGPTYHAFEVSGVAAAPVPDQSSYAIGDAVYRVRAVALSAGAGRVTAQRLSGAVDPPPAGTLTRLSGPASDDAIAFSRWEPVASNPFWFDGALSFPRYLEAHALPPPDWVLVLLGTNDVFSAKSDAAVLRRARESFAELDLLIASIATASPSTRVALLTSPPPTASDEVFRADYGDAQTRARFKRNILIWDDELLRRYRAREAEGIHVVGTHLAIDTAAHMANGVHPADEGYRQLAEVVWAFLKAHAR